MKDILDKIRLLENFDCDPIEVEYTVDFVDDTFDDDNSYVDEIFDDIVIMKEKILDMQSENLSNQTGFSEAIMRVIYLLDALEEKYYIKRKP